MENTACALELTLHPLCLMSTVVSRSVVLTVLLYTYAETVKYPLSLTGTYHPQWLFFANLMFFSHQNPSPFSSSCALHSTLTFSFSHDHHLAFPNLSHQSNHQTSYPSFNWRSTLQFFTGTLTTQ